ncbi:phosphoenolpyruvate synthase [Candidatus Peregrinibacteria bacterium]|nr:phosphoenolpyruvate synthase [Candidatus Peregrinibacteria bacterium]
MFSKLFKKEDRTKKFILWFKELGIKDVPLVGGKNASLGEMYQKLTRKGVRIPNGFAVSAYAYHYLLEKAGIKQQIKKILSDLNTKNMDNLATRGRQVRELIRNASFPKELEQAIIASYHKMEKLYGKDCDVAVRSSATAEDLPDASFAGQQETYLNIRGDAAVIRACKNCFASLFTNRAISYRVDKHFDHFSIGLSIGVQKMVRSDLACSGVMFSIDTETGFRDAVLITGAYGLGENVVQGAVNTDEFYVFKPTLKQGFKPIISKKLGSKSLRMVYSHEEGKSPTRNQPVDLKLRKHFCVTDEEVLTLAKWAVIIEDHYTKEAGHFKPMDMEWAKDGKDNQLYIVQARPETVQSRKDLSVLETYVLKEKGKVLVTGSPVGARIGVGKAHVIENAAQIGAFRQGEVLVTDMTDPDWEPIMKIASAIVTNRGGRTCHAAIISRELGIPCVVGTEKGTKALKRGQKITVACEGEEGKIYEGILPFEIKKTDLKHIKMPKTSIMMNIGSPEIAFETSFIPNAGVGLAREEFIINSYIKIHPLALINYSTIPDPVTKDKIDELTEHYPASRKTDYFVDKLAEGVAMIGAAFYPNPVIVRMSDFKTNEYANLIGGAPFEPKEDNPMIGWRGASRYYDPKYRAGFALECKAMRKVREVMGLTNVKVMIPFCRTVEEGQKVLTEMAKNGLRRGVNGLEVYVMCEIPSNVILAEEFCKIFDGFSIGSNDLTQLTLGVDRDSELVSHIYSERNEAVKTLIRNVIRVAKKHGRKVGICGQAPSDFPDFAEFLVKEGIDSISLNPDTVVKTILFLN